nr:MAG TPA: hypothetical protein [Caudoviricetes sp.]
MCKIHRGDKHVDSFSVIPCSRSGFAGGFAGSEIEHSFDVHVEAILLTDCFPRFDVIYAEEHISGKTLVLIPAFCFHFALRVDGHEPFRKCFGFGTANILCGIKLISEVVRFNDVIIEKVDCRNAVADKQLCNYASDTSRADNIANALHLFWIEESGYLTEIHDLHLIPCPRVIFCKLIEHFLIRVNIICAGIRCDEFISDGSCLLRQLGHRMDLVECILNKQRHTCYTDAEVVMIGIPYTLLLVVYDRSVHFAALIHNEEDEEIISAHASGDVFLIVRITSASERREIHMAMTVEIDGIVQTVIMEQPLLIFILVSRGRRAVDILLKGQDVIDDVLSVGDLSYETIPRNLSRAGRNQRAHLYP